jgi:hypothetical protein
MLCAKKKYVNSDNTEEATKRNQYTGKTQEHTEVKHKKLLHSKTEKVQHTTKHTTDHTVILHILYCTLYLIFYLNFYF